MNTFVSKRKVGLHRNPNKMVSLPFHQPVVINKSSLRTKRDVRKPLIIDLKIRILHIQALTLLFLKYLMADKMTEWYEKLGSTAGTCSVCTPINILSLTDTMSKVRRAKQEIVPQEQLQELQ